MPTENTSEISGSLTGHILAQGWDDAPTPKSRTTKMVVMLLIGLGIVVTVGLLAATLAGDAVSSIFDGVLGH